MISLFRRLVVEIEGEIVWENSGEEIGFQEIFREGK